MVYLKSEKYQYFEFSIFVENVVTVSSHSWELFVLYCPLIILDNPIEKGSKDICFRTTWLLRPASYYWIFIVGLFPRYILNGFQPITEGLNKMWQLLFDRVSGRRQQPSGSFAVYTLWVGLEL